MRCYIDGRLSEDNKKVKFLLGDLWFSETRDYDDLEDCTRISGCFCETSGDDYEVGTRWKGVTWTTCDTDDEELNDLARLRELIEGKYLVNAEAYYDVDTEFYIDCIKFVQGDDEWIFPNDKVDEIEFIVWD